MGSGIKYSQEFRDDLVRAVIEHSQPIRVVAEQAGVKPDTLRTWIHRARREGLPMGNKKPSYEELEAQNKNLKDQVKRQDRLLATEKKRVEFLGKAAPVSTILGGCILLWGIVRLQRCSGPMNAGCQASLGGLVTESQNLP